MGCYQYRGASYQDNLSRYKILPRVISQDTGGTETLLLGGEQTSYFSVTEVKVTDEFPFRDTGTFSIVIVLDGEGEMIYEGGRMSIRKSNEIFLPAGIKNLIWANRGRTPLKLIRAFPPEVL